MFGFASNAMYGKIIQKTKISKLKRVLVPVRRHRIHQLIYRHRSKYKKRSTEEKQKKDRDEEQNEETGGQGEVSGKNIE